MRLWTVHPMYLDRQGLTALWREGLLAQKVLRGKTKGYRAHPQLIRFRNHPDPLGAMGAYLREVHAEAVRRGYRFDGSKILRKRGRKRMTETRSQLLFEWDHLRKKLRKRSPALARANRRVRTPRPHPLFRIMPSSLPTSPG
jgi:hypothetical protein